MLMWQLMWHTKNSRATWRRMRTPRVTHICMRARVRARVCAHVRACARVWLMRISTLFKNFAISLITQHLYTLWIVKIFVMWNYISIFLCVGDITSCRASDRAIINRHLSEECIQCTVIYWRIILKWFDLNHSP